MKNYASRGGLASAQNMGFRETLSELAFQNTNGSMQYLVDTDDSNDQEAQIAERRVSVLSKTPDDRFFLI